MKKLDHISLLLKTLWWFLIRVKPKVLTLAYEANDLAPISTTLRLIRSISATLVPLLSLKHTGCSAASGPLHLMFLLLETFFLVSSLLLPHLLPVFVQWHLNESFLIHLIANCTSNPTMMIYSSPLPSFIFRHSTNKLTYYMYLLIWFFSYLFLPQIEWTGVFMFAHCWLKCLKSTWHTTDTQLVQNKWMNGSFTNHHHNPLPPFSYLRVPLPL